MEKIIATGPTELNTISIDHSVKIKHPIRVEFRGKENTIIIGAGAAVTNLRIVFVGDGSIVKIGENCKAGGTILVEEKCLVEIGDKTKINYTTTRIHCGEPGTRILIGHGCLLANVRFRTSDEHSIVDLLRNERINKAQDIIVKDRVWLAEDVNIYKGVVIGEGTIVGARSTVTRDLPENSLCVGTPAKPIKTDVTWTHEKL